MGTAHGNGPVIDHASPRSTDAVSASVAARPISRLALGPVPSPSAPPTAVQPASRPPKLLNRLAEALRARHYSRRTEQAYRHWVG